MSQQVDKSPLTVRPEAIVISGIGGRYPESDSLDEFRDNLYNNVDMICGDDRRWPVGKSTFCSQLFVEYRVYF